MAKKQTVDITEDWKLRERGIAYSHSISPDYYATVARNWRGFNLQLWDNVNSGGLPVVNLPMLQRIVRQFVAYVMTNSVKMQYTIENIADDTSDPAEQERLRLASYLSKNSADRWEKLKMDALIRRVLYDGAMSGDMCLHTYWDDSVKTGQTNGEEYVKDDSGSYVTDENGMPTTQPVAIHGDFITEAIDGVNVYFGNPNDCRVNVNGKPYQPYIIIAGREVVSKLRKEAKAYRKETGLTEEEIKNRIVADEDYEEQAGDRGKKELEGSDSQYGKTTYIIKYWVDDDGRIMMNKSVKECFIRKNVDTELTLYPVAWANWDTIKNSYHGQAVATGLINNQLEIDRAFAKLFKYLSDMAFPRTAYNTNVLPNGLSNKIGETIPVDVNENTSLSNVLYSPPPAQLANKVIDIIEVFMRHTLNLMGVSDSTLGAVNPQNTSAIIANTQNAAIPLENVKANLYQLLDDNGYIWLDFMLRKYNIPRKIAINEGGIRQLVPFDASKLQNEQLRIKIDVGPSTYWSEAALVRTMENLFLKGAVDAIQLIERIPEEQIPEKEKLIAELKERMKMQELQAELARNPQLAQMVGGGMNVGGQQTPSLTA